MKCFSCDKKTSNPKFCNRSCSAKYNNRKRIKKRGCASCNKQLIWYQKKYCSNQCQSDLRYKTFITEWQLGFRKGIDINGQVTNWLKKYLRQKYENKCCLCGWSKVNPFTGKVPLVADHIDGHCDNNVEENLRLVCWNCDSLGSTFGAQNKGNGRSVKFGRKVTHCGCSV